MTSIPSSSGDPEPAVDVVTVDGVPVPTRPWPAGLKPAVEAVYRVVYHLDLQRRAPEAYDELADALQQIVDVYPPWEPPPAPGPLPVRGDLLEHVGAARRDLREFSETQRAIDDAHDDPGLDPERRAVMRLTIGPVGVLALALNRLQVFLSER